MSYSVNFCYINSYLNKVNILNNNLVPKSLLFGLDLFKFLLFSSSVLISFVSNKFL